MLLLFAMLCLLTLSIDPALPQEKDKPIRPSVEQREGNRMDEILGRVDPADTAMRPHKKKSWQKELITDPTPDMLPDEEEQKELGMSRPRH